MRTRLRKLRVGGREFTWRAEIGVIDGDGGDCHRLIDVRVWGAGKRSRPLVAALLSKSLGAGWSPAATDGAYPSANDVRQLIEAGLAFGWEPDVLGGTYPLTESAGLELPDFLITERVWRPEAPDPTRRVLQANERRIDVDADTNRRT
ncbi:hypothetical protein ACWDYH_31055 [Nocardia goodfellowii]